MRLSAVLILWVMCLCAGAGRAQTEAPPPGTPSDTAAADTGKTAADTLRTDTLNIARNSGLEKTVTYSAQDSIVLNLNTKDMAMFEQATVDYEGMTMESARIRVAYDSNLVYARGVPDSFGDPTKTPVFTDNGQTYDAERLKYNFKTKQGHIVYARTQQDLDHIRGDTIKRNPDNSYYIKNARFTSCDCDTTGFYFKAKKVKVIPNDKIISGPAVMYLADIPTPLFIPFAFFPDQDNRSSGILLPEYGNSISQGYFFRNMGYYWAANPHLGLQFTGDIYTKGSFAARLGADYDWRYSAQGQLNLEYQRIGGQGAPAFAEPGDADFNFTRTYRIRWNHSQNINPQTSLSGDINYSSSQLAQQFGAQQNINQFAQQQLQSSLALQYRPPNSEWNLAVAANGSQDLQRGTVNLTLPNINLSRTPIYPFKRKQAIGKEKWYESVNVRYNADIQNQFQNVPDSLFLTPAMRDYLNAGLRQNASVQTNFSILQHITVQPSISYREYTYLQETRKFFETDAVRDTFITSIDSLNGQPVDTTFGDSLRQTQELITERPYDFLSGRDFNMNVSASTNIYGLLQPRGAENQFALRHTLRPQVAYTYRPDFAAPDWGYYRSIEPPLTGRETLYSRFEGGVFGGPGAGEQQQLSFGLNNVVEGKYIPRDEAGDLTVDSAGVPQFEYLTIFEQLSANASYNFAADSFGLSNIALSARTNLLDNKLTINGGATLSPYRFVPVFSTGDEPREIIGGRRVDEVVLGPRNLGHLTQARINLSTSFRAKEYEKRDLSKMTTEQRALYRRFRDFHLPWSVNLSYNASYNRPTPFDTVRLNHSFSVSGKFKWTQKWDVTFQSGYDFTQRQIVPMRVSVSRDLGCWEMDFTATPIGPPLIRQYTLRLAVKSPTLSELQLEKRRLPQDNPNF